MKKYDFSGWATRNDLLCSDGRTIRKDAFKDNDGQTVPLVWNHQHNDPLNVLGHALLENRNEGVYAYCTFNDTEAGKNAKQLVEHGDVSALSIYANRLKQQGANVIHGAIREVSLVLAGANPGAFIDTIMQHGELSEDEAIIYTGEDIMLFHADNSSENEDTIAHANDKKQEENSMEEKEKKPEGEETIKDVYDTLTDKQKDVLNYLVGCVALEFEVEDEDMMPRIKKVIFNDPATIVFWKDGTKTVVKCGDGDIFDPEKGLAMAIAKKALGNKGHYFETVKKWTEGYSEENSSE